MAEQYGPAVAAEKSTPGVCLPKKQGTRELPREFPLYFFLTF